MKTDMNLRIEELSKQRGMRMSDLAAKMGGKPGESRIITER